MLFLDSSETQTRVIIYHQAINQTEPSNRVGWMNPLLWTRMTISFPVRKIGVSWAWSNCNNFWVISLISLSTFHKVHFFFSSFVWSFFCWLHYHIGYRSSPDWMVQFGLFLALYGPYFDDWNCSRILLSSKNPIPSGSFVAPYMTYMSFKSVNMVL